MLFAVLSVLVVQHRYRRWRRLGRLLSDLPDPPRGEQARRLRLEGWRLVLMTLSLVTMTGLVFATFLEAAPVMLSTLRLLALAAVMGVLLLSLLS